jgi:hypothetical protein
MGGSMSFCGVSGLDRSSLTRLLLTALLPVALMIVSASAHAQQGANGMDGADCFTSGCFAGSGVDGEPVTGGGNAVGGNGGSAFGLTFGAFGGSGGNAGDFQLVGDASEPGNGGDATAIGSGTVTAIGGAGGFGFSQSGNASATSSATAGSGSATASATLGGGGFSFSPVANATSYAKTAGGGLAQARAQGDGGGEVQSTAKTTFGGVSAQSTVIGGRSTEAIAQGGSGQFPVNPGFDGLAFATALPNTAYANRADPQRKQCRRRLARAGRQVFVRQLPAIQWEAAQIVDGNIVTRRAWIEWENSGNSKTRDLIIYLNCPRPQSAESPNPMTIIDRNFGSSARLLGPKQNIAGGVCTYTAENSNLRNLIGSTCMLLPRLLQRYFDEPHVTEYCGEIVSILGDMSDIGVTPKNAMQICGRNCADNECNKQ